MRVRTPRAGQDCLCQESWPGTGGLRAGNVGASALLQRLLPALVRRRWGLTALRQRRNKFGRFEQVTRQTFLRQFQNNLQP